MRKIDSSTYKVIILFKNELDVLINSSKRFIIYMTWKPVGIHVNIITLLKKYFFFAALDNHLQQRYLKSFPNVKIIEFLKLVTVFEHIPFNAKIN